MLFAQVESTAMQAPLGLGTDARDECSHCHNRLRTPWFVHSQHSVQLSCPWQAQARDDHPEVGAHAPAAGAVPAGDGGRAPRRRPRRIRCPTGRRRHGAAEACPPLARTPQGGPTCGPVGGPVVGPIKGRDSCDSVEACGKRCAGMRITLLRSLKTAGSGWMAQWQDPPCRDQTYRELAR